MFQIVVDCRIQLVEQTTVEYPIFKGVTLIIVAAMSRKTINLATRASAPLQLVVCDITSDTWVTYRTSETPGNGSSR